MQKHHCFCALYYLCQPCPSMCYIFKPCKTKIIFLFVSQCTCDSYSDLWIVSYFPILRVTIRRGNHGQMYRWGMHEVFSHLFSLCLLPILDAIDPPCLPSTSHPLGLKIAFLVTVHFKTVLLVLMSLFAVFPLSVFPRTASIAFLSSHIRFSLSNFISWHIFSYHFYADD